MPFAMIIGNRHKQRDIDNHHCGTGQVDATHTISLLIVWRLAYFYTTDLACHIGNALAGFAGCCAARSRRATQK